MADGIVTNTIMAAPDTLLGVVKIKFIIYKLAKKTKTLLSFTCGYIKLKKNNYVLKII